MDNNAQQMIVCPSCGKRYALSDFKDDRLVCSACGREIPRVLSVGSVDEAKYVKQYMDRVFNLQKRLDPFIFTPLFELLFFWLLTTGISLWWKLLVLFFAIGFPCFFFVEYRKHLQVRRIFKQNNYRLKESVSSFMYWYSQLSDNEKNDVPDEYKDSFVQDLENYVKSHAELKQNYEQTHGQQNMLNAMQASQTYRFLIPQTQQGYEVYDYPPERCPGCGKLYGLADFSTDNVQCRHCGKLIKIKCQISDEDMKGLIANLRKKIRKKQTEFNIISFVFFIILTFVIYKQIASVGWYVYFSSWHVLTMLFESIIFLEPMMNKEERALMRLLKQDNPDILSIEIYIKRYAGRNSSISNEEKAFAEFKKTLFNLYRTKGKVIGRY